MISTMQTLAEVMRRIRGESTFVDLAERTGVSRQTLMAVEAGASTKLSTLREVAKHCQLSDNQWDEVVVAWIACELGASDFDRLIRRLSPDFPEKGNDEKAMRVAYKRLSEQERRIVLTCAMNPNLLLTLVAIVELQKKAMTDLKSGTTPDYEALVEKHFGPKAHK